MRVKTHRGYYVNANKKFGEKKRNYNGRTGKNMNRLKRDEYHNLLYYLMYDEHMEYGYLLPIYRCRKNMKYRKKFIKEFQERMKA